MFNYNHLYYFYVTARLGGVSNASKHLAISQPSLSAQVKTFEGSVGRKLFQKNGRKMQLTSEGEQVYAYCQQIFEIADDLSEHLKNADIKEMQRIHIGVSDQIERPFVADLLGDILRQGKEHINCIMNVSSGDEQELREKLKDQKIDLFLTNNSFQGDGLNEIASVRMPVALVVAKDVLKKNGFKKPPTLQELFKKDIIGLLLPAPRLRLRQEINLFLRQKKLKKPILMESDILSVIGRAVIDSGGCAFLPIPYILNEMKLGILEIIGPEEVLWKHSLTLISRKQLKYDPLFDEIKNNLIKLNSPVWRVSK
jgi:LysR family transcriptional activator of nhaA